VKNFLLGTKAVHAPMNGLQEGDALVATFCRPNEELSCLVEVPAVAWVSGKVTCGNCLRKIAKQHVQATEINDLLNEGIAEAERMLVEYGEHNFGSTATDTELAEMVRLQEEWLALDINTACDYLGKQMRKNLVARATLVVLYQAEVAYREKLMVTENNYGEQGPFHFTEHPHDQVRAQRYDSIINTLTEMVASTRQPVPTTEQLIDAILGLEHGEAIEEDRARFPHESFTRFGVPVPVKHRLADGTIEQVHMVGSDVSRQVYPQNVVLIARPYDMAQVVPEGDLVS